MCANTHISYMCTLVTFYLFECKNPTNTTLVKECDFLRLLVFCFKCQVFQKQPNQNMLMPFYICISTTVQTKHVSIKTFK